jgi:hypothetical protein
MAREPSAGRDGERSERPRPVVIDGLLSGMAYPATRGDLVARAQNEAAPVIVVRALNDLPERDYANATDVMREIGNFM